MAAFREAEARGLDLDRSMPDLVKGRTNRSGYDVASLLLGLRPLELPNRIWRGHWRISWI